MKLAFPLSAARQFVRARNDKRDLRRAADALEVIARGLAAICQREYGIDIVAPPTAVKIREQDLTVGYVDDREQAIAEAEEALLGAERAAEREASRSVEQRQLDELLGGL